MTIKHVKKLNEFNIPNDAINIYGNHLVNFLIKVYHVLTITFNQTIFKIRDCTETIQIIVVFIVTFNHFVKLGYYEMRKI